MADRDFDFWLLDLDGTIVDVHESYIQDVLEEVGARVGYGFSTEQAHQCWYGTTPTRARVLREADIDQATFWDVFHAVDDPHMRAEATYVYDDAATTVPELSGPVGLVTHCQAALTEPILDSLDIQDWFDTVVCCNDDVGWKPDPEPVHQAMTELDVNPAGSRGVLAGDNIEDVDAALNAGLDAVHIDRESTTAPHSVAPRFRRIARLTDLAT